MRSIEEASQSFLRRAATVGSVLSSRLSVFLPKRRSLVRGIVVSVAAFLGSMRLAGFPDVAHLHASSWQFVPVLAAAWGMFETARCMGKSWSLYHAGVLILLYSELMILAMAVFLWVYPL
jgi:hypothetical protein